MGSDVIFWGERRAAAVSGNARQIRQAYPWSCKWHREEAASTGVPRVVGWRSFKSSVQWCYLIMQLKQAALIQTADRLTSCSIAHTASAAGRLPGRPRQLLTDESKTAASTAFTSGSPSPEEVRLYVAVTEVAWIRMGHEFAYLQNFVCSPSAFCLFTLRICTW